MAEGTKDPYVGEVYEDRDPRSNGRRIRILERHPEQWRPEQFPDGIAYRAIRVDELGRALGKQRVRIMRRTLDSHYRKVSH